LRRYFCPRRKGGGSGRFAEDEIAEGRDAE
jgi:hypothetical protein